MTLSFNAQLLASLVLTLALATAGSAAPVVSLSRSLDVDGSGFDALDFFYSSSPDAEFTNYRLNFETTNGAYIFDPDSLRRQCEGCTAVDTYMNTVGSSLGLSTASHVYNYNSYRPSAPNSAPPAISQLDWSVFDTLRGDTNAIGGGAAPFHLARVLISPQAEWNAAFTAYDTSTQGVGTRYKYLNSLIPVIETTLPPLPAPPVIDIPPPATPIITPVITPPTAPPATIARPTVSMTRSHNIGGSGFDALDIFYAAPPGAEFTNYRLNLQTTNGAHIFDPDPLARQSAGGQAIDTFMNTVGSSLGLSDASQVFNVYQPSIRNDSSPVAQIDWSVFDTLRGDSNEIGGEGAAPFHMARVLINPDAEWNATFTPYDTLSQGLGTKFKFNNSLTPQIEAPIIPQPASPVSTSPPPVVTEPITPPAIDPSPPVPVGPANPPVAADPPAAPVEEPTAPAIDDPVDSDTQPPSTEEPVVTLPLIDVPYSWRPLQPWMHLIDPFDPTILAPGHHLVHVDEDGAISIVPIGAVGNVYVHGMTDSLIDFGQASTFGDVVAADGPVSLTNGLRTSLAGYAGMAHAYNMTAATMTTGSAQQGAPEPTSAMLAMLAVAFLCGFRRHIR